MQGQEALQQQGHQRYANRRQYRQPVNLNLLAGNGRGSHYRGVSFTGFSGLTGSATFAPVAGLSATTGLVAVA